jgi:nucleoside-diphosphate-sugar epimerase
MGENQFNHVLITGSAGFLGSLLAGELLRSGSTVTIIDDLSFGNDMTFGGDMCDTTVSYDQFRRELGFETRLAAEDGIRDVLHTIRSGMISNPYDQRYRNAQFIVQ